MPIAYRNGYKYQLVSDYAIATGFAPGGYHALPLAAIDPIGTLIIKAGYAWDGPSGPVPDVPEAMRGSLIHDCLYEFMRVGGLDRSWKPYADKLLYKLCVEDGMNEIFARTILEGVTLFGEPFTEPNHENPVITVGS